MSRKKMGISENTTERRETVRARALVVSKQTPAYSIRGNAKEKAVNNPNKDGFLEVESQRRMDNTTPGIKY